MGPHLRSHSLNDASFAKDRIPPVPNHCHPTTPNLPSRQAAPSREPVDREPLRHLQNDIENLYRMVERLQSPHSHINVFPHGRTRPHNNRDDPLPTPQRDYTCYRGTSTSRARDGDPPPVMHSDPIRYQGVSYVPRREYGRHQGTPTTNTAQQLQDLPLTNAHVPTFGGSSDNDDASAWLDDLKLLVHQYRLSNDSICRLFPLCLRGDEAKRQFKAFPLEVRNNWASLCSAWLEAYPPLDSRESPLTILQDFRNLRVDERSLVTEHISREGKRVWELISFSRELASVGHRVSGMTSLAKGREALFNLPPAVRNYLPVYEANSEPTLERLCHDLTSADHHAIAADVQRKFSLSDTLTSIQRNLNELSSADYRPITMRNSVGAHVSGSDYPPLLNDIHNVPLYPNTDSLEMTNLL